MPLDGHSYLVKQGWTGKGNGLRHGSISRPLAIPQKRNLAGLGKDRDEAFPFWDQSVLPFFFTILLSTDYLTLKSVYLMPLRNLVSHRL